jgi:hypothetical protein
MLPYSLLLHTASRVRTVSRGYTRPCSMWNVWVGARGRVGGWGWVNGVGWVGDVP